MVHIEQCKLFEALSPSELELLWNSARLVNVANGSVIFNEGDVGDGVYLIKSGKVQIFSRVGEEHEKEFATFGVGEIFGEMAIIENKSRSATAKAVEDTELYFIPCEAMANVLERSPKVALCFLKDISRRLRKFDKHYIKEVIQAERLAIVGRFARSIVHDLKNPLNIIGIAADMASMENATNESRQEARIRIRHQIERISNMVNELLDYTQGAHTSFILSLINYSDYVTPLIYELKGEVALKKVELVLQNQPPSVSIAMDPKRLSRVFYNLVHNATEAMPNGGKIFVNFSLETDKVVTEIQDTGRGIQPEAMAHLFEPFFSYGKSHGTGLGLSICKKIITEHNGNIQAKNAPEGGAVFSFTLPFKIS